jgi:hypothetical protein
VKRHRKSGWRTPLIREVAAGYTRCKTVDNHASQPRGIHGNKQPRRRFAPLSDAMVAVEPEPEAVARFRAVAGAEVPAIGQQPIAWDPDAAAAITGAHERFRWFGGGWKVNT